MKKTPFYPLMVQEGAKINETAWNTAAVYTNVAEEHYAVRNAVGATDWSTMCKFDIKGPDAKEFIHTIGDAHIYRNHFDVVKEQISRKPLPMCKLVLNPEVKSIFDYKIEDIKIEGYQSYGRLVGKVSV